METHFSVFVEVCFRDLQLLFMPPPSSQINTAQVARLYALYIALFSTLYIAPVQNLRLYESIFCDWVSRYKCTEMLSDNRLLLRISAHKSSWGFTLSVDIWLVHEADCHGLSRLIITTSQAAQAGFIKVICYWLNSTWAQTYWPDAGFAHFVFLFFCHSVHSILLFV